MFVCDNARAEVWQPDFSSSGQASPIWTRVTCAGRELTNSLEWVDWPENPVQVILCDACGYLFCAPGNYVHVSRLGGHVLWSTPQTDDPGQQGMPAILRARGAVAIPDALWDGWAAAVPDLPPAARFAPANHAAVADAWVLGPARTAASILPTLEEKLIGGDTLAKDAAIALVASALAFLRAHAEAPFEGALVPLADMRIETLYFDGPPDWPAFAFADGETYLALNREHGVRLDPDVYSRRAWKPPGPA